MATSNCNIRKGYADVIPQTNGTPNVIINRNHVAIKSIDQISWYVGKLSREQAESLLVDCVNGTFLLRESPRHTHYAVSVKRDIDSYKHFFLQFNATTGQCYFGPEQYDSLDSFVQYMGTQPIVNHESDEPICLLFEYSKFQDIVEIRKRRPSQPPDSKRGFMIKRGVFHKTWKERWFVVENDVMKYYAKRTDEKPIKTFRISTATDVEHSDVDGKTNCFSLTLPYRTFYFIGKSSKDTESWMNFFKARIEYWRALAMNS